MPGSYLGLCYRPCRMYSAGAFRIWHRVGVCCGHELRCVELCMKKKSRKRMYRFRDSSLSYSKPGSNRHDHYWSQDFKSGVSTYSTIRALRRRTIVQKYYFYLILQNLCVDICYYLFDLFGGEPRYLGVAPEPRHLAFGIAAGVALDGFDRLVETRLMVDIVEYLAIPYRLQSVASRAAAAATAPRLRVRRPPCDLPSDRCVDTAPPARCRCLS